MKAFHIITAFFVCALLSLCGSAVGAESASYLTDINSIIEKSLQAYGDKEHLLLLAKRGQFIGTISKQSNDWKKEAYRYARKDAAWRQDIDCSLISGVPEIESTLYDGTNYWQSISTANNASAANNTINKPAQKPDEQEDEMPPMAPVVNGSAKSNLKIAPTEEWQWLADESEREPFILVNWQNPAYQFRLIGRSTYKQIPVYGVEIKDAQERTCTLYIDCSNYLVSAISFQSSPIINPGSQPRKVNVTKEYSENRPILGGIWPFKEVLLISKEPVSIIEISTIKITDDTATALFQVPKAQNSPLYQDNQTRLIAPVTVPFEYAQKEILCRGKIENVEPLWFLIDTGTSDTLIDRSFAAQCLLPKGDNYQIAAFRGKIQSETTKIDRLELGTLAVNNVTAQIADLSAQSKQVGRSIAGIIGMNVLANYLVTIDYAKPCLIFADAATGSRPEGASSIPFAPMNNVQSSLANAPPIPRIKVGLPGGDNPILLIDTGAAFNHLAASTANKHLADNLEKTTRSIQATGLDGRPIELGLLTLDPVIVGSYKVHRVKFTYAVEPKTGGPAASTDKKSEETTKQSGDLVWQHAKLGADTLSKELDAAGLLGNPFFEHFLVTIDSGFHRLLLKPNPQFEVTYELEQALAAGDNALYTKRDFRQAEFAYQKALMIADNAHALLYQALAQGRMGNLRRIMSHDLKRPEHAQMSYQYFKKANELAVLGNLKEAQGRILADWSLLYSENGQIPEAQQTMQKAMQLAPKDAVVNIDYAVHLFRDRSYAEAQKYIDKALFYDPGNWQALWYQVKLSDMFGDQAKERTTLKEILQRYPGSKVAESKLKSLEGQ